MIAKLASLPIYLVSQDNYNDLLSKFRKTLESDGLFVSKYSDCIFEISHHKSSQFNNIFITFPSELSYELNICTIYNIDGWPRGVSNITSLISTTGIPITFNLLSALSGSSIKNPDRIMREPFCKKIFEKFISTFDVFRCPQCGALTFKREAWEHEESRFTEDRIGHGLNAIATVLFLGGHGAGGEWSQATKPRKKESGFNLICTKCGYVKSVTTSVEDI